MRGKIKFHKEIRIAGAIKPFAWVSVSKKRFQSVWTDPSLAKTLNVFKSIEFADKPFGGSVPVVFWFGVNPGSVRTDGAYICGEWANKLGLKSGDTLHVKFNRKD